MEVPHLSSYAKSAVAKAKAMLTFRPLVYGYANARVRAMRSAYVNEGLLSEMMSVGSVSEVIELLERTTYKDDLVPLSLKYKGEELVELALSANFARFAQKLRRTTPKEGQECVDALLARWDVRNLKNILQGRKLSRKFEEISPLLATAGTLGIEELRRLCEAKDSLEFYLALRSTAFGKRMLDTPHSAFGGTYGIKRLIVSGQAHDIEGLDAFLDGYYFYLAKNAVVASDNESRAISRMLSSEADAKNLSTALRLRNAAKKPAHGIRNMVVPGGELTVRELGEIYENADNNDKLLHAARKLGVAGSLEEFATGGKVSSLEIALEQKSARESLRSMHRLQMSLGAMVGALILKEQEMNNIRKIVRGKALGLPRERIAAMIVSAE